MSRPPLNLSLYSSILPDSPEAILAADPGIRGITRPAVPELKGKWAYKTADHAKGECYTIKRRVYLHLFLNVQKRADELMMVTEENVRRLKMSTYDYIDSVLYKFQEQMAQLNDMYAKMFDDLENTFNRVENMLNANRDEIKDMAYRTQMGHDGNGISNHGE